MLVRHGVTAETGRVLTGRLPGVALSDVGRLDARVVAEHLAGENVDAVFTSPIRRCRETARIVAEPHDLTPVTDRSFIETDFGRWSGRTLKDLGRLKSWGRLMTSASRFRFPDGETLGEVQARSVAGLERVAETVGNGTIIVVSHADVIRTLLCHYLGTPLDLIHRLHVAPTSLSVVELDTSGTVRVPTVNQTFRPLTPS
jgi:broad specificity phosphatase PhoE